MTGTSIAEVTTPAHKAIARLGGPGIPEIIPQTMDEVWRFSQVIANSGLTPKGIEKAEQVTIQILMGFDLGLKPMVAVQNIHVINNKPCIGGDLALSILLNSGLLEDHDERVEGEGDARVAYCTVTRKGMRQIERKFSVKDAIQAGLWQTEATIYKEYFDKKLNKRVKSQWATANDSPWWRFQERMLIMRARGFAFRDRFTDVLKGMHLTEEMEGHVDDVPERQISGPSAPPPDEPFDAIISGIPEAETVRATEVKQPTHVTQTREEQQPTRGPSAPPADDPEDADIIEGDGSAEDVFDFDSWLEEVKEAAATCMTPENLDELENMFSSTVEELLSRPQRDLYDEIIFEAHTRLEQAAAAGAIEKPAAKETSGPTVPPLDDEAEDQDDQQPEPTAGDLYEAEINAEMEREGVTAGSLTDLWNDKYGGKLHRNKMVKAGTWTAERLNALKDRVAAKRDELLAPKDKPAAEEKPAGEAGGEAQDPKAAFTEEFRTKLESFDNLDALNAYVTETLPVRNELLKPDGDEVHSKLWRTMIKKRRDTFA